MKNIIAFIKNVLTPVSVALILLLGCLAAFLSGVIEFVVLKELFSKITIGDETHMFSFLPLIIVIILEGSKLFLHFGSSSITQSKTVDKSSKSLAITMNKIKISLIVFSFVCSLIFTSNFLYKQSFSSVNTKIAEKTVQINEAYDSEIDKLILFYEDNLRQAQDRLNALEPVFSPKSAYVRYRQLLEEYTKEVEKAKNDYQNAVAAKQGISTDEDMQNLVNEIRENQRKDISESSESISQTNVGDNEIISTFLMSFTRVFFNNKPYSRGTYFSVVLLISLFIAGALEAIIYISQRIASMPTIELESVFSDHNYPQNKLKESLNYGAKILISSVLSFCIFLMFGLIKEIAFSKFDMISAIICSGLTMITCAFIKKPERIVEPNAYTSRTKNFFVNHFFPECQIGLIKAMLSFALFIILGIIFGHEVTELTLQAIGVAIGSALGPSLKIKPIPLSV